MHCETKKPLLVQAAVFLFVQVYVLLPQTNPTPRQITRSILIGIAVFSTMQNVMAGIPSRQPLMPNENASKPHRVGDLFYFKQFIKHGHERIVRFEETRIQFVIKRDCVRFRFIPLGNLDALMHHRKILIQTDTNAARNCCA